jgi:hypothetical protein
MYLLRECQKRDWKLHKSQNCGQNFSSFTSPPVVVASPSVPPSKPFHPLRAFILDCLAEAPKEFWIIKVKDSNILREGFDGSDDNGTNLRITAALREVAYSALIHGTQASIDLLAYALINSTLEPRPFDDNVVRLPSSTGPASIGECFEKQDWTGISPTAAREQQFRAMFHLTDEEDWKASLERGKVEIEKSEHKGVKEYHLELQNMV